MTDMPDWRAWADGAHRDSMSARHWRAQRCPYCGVRKYGRSKSLVRHRYRCKKRVTQKAEL